MNRLTKPFLPRILAACGMLALVGGGPSGTRAAEPFAELTASAESTLRGFMDEQDLKGAALALVYPGEEPWSRGFGEASRTPAVPFSAGTPNALHELGKLIVAVAVLQQVEEGRVDLDAPFSRYFPTFRPYAATQGQGEFTIRQLLTHHSGLPSHYAPQSGSEGMALGEDWDAYREVLARAGDLALVSTPGQVYNYSYLGYVLLGLLVEEVSGLPFEAYARTRIFEPLGMTGTWFGAVNEAPDDAAVGQGPWRAFEEGQWMAHKRFRDLPAAGLVSSAADMARLLHALMNGGEGLLSQASLEEMFRPQNAEVREDGNFRIGLGFFLTPVTGGLYSRGEFSVSHAATDGIARSYLLAFPRYRVGLLLTSNTAVNSVALRDAVDRIAERLLDSLDAPGALPFELHAEVDLDPERAARLTAAYSGPGGTYYVELRRNRLHLDLPQLPFLKVRLQPREDGFYGVSVRFLGLGLGMLPQVKQVAASVEARLEDVEGEKVLHWYWRGVTAVSLSEIPPVTSSADRDAWVARASTYRSELTGWRYELRFDERSGQFLFGPKQRGLGLIPVPAELLCVESSDTLRTCARGLQGTGTRTVLRLLGDGRLLDARGVHYTE